MTYSNEVLQIKVSDHLEIIGPSEVALIGGSIGIYLKTKGKRGKANISISSKHYGDVKKTITVL